MRDAVERGPVSRSEWRWVWVWASVVAALTCVPYIYAYLAAPSDHTFSGFLINTQDGNSYLAKMRQGYDGAWLFRLPFTPEDQRGIFVFTFYLALGHAARLTGLPLIFIFHLARAASGIFFLFTVYRLTAELTPGVPARRWAFAIAAFGSGLSVLSLLIGRSDPQAFAPVDLYVAEANGFYSILTNPHFPFAFALEAWAILWTLCPPRRGLWIRLLAVSVIGAALVSLAPYLAPVVWVAVGAGVAISRPIHRDTIFRGAALIVATGIFLLYDAWAMRSDPAVAAWAAQNVTSSPPLVDTLLGLGIWIPLAMVGAGCARDRCGCKPLPLALAAWVVTTIVLLYLPYPLQRRFFGGVFIPLSILGGIGIAWLFVQLQRSWLRIALGMAVIILGFMTNALVMTALLTAPKTADPMVYLSNDEAAALRWLATQTDSNDVVLADARLGNFVPGWTGARVVYGHPMETIHAAVKRAEVEAFYSGASEEILDRYRVKYIVGGMPPAGWRVVFESGEVRLYAR